MQFKVIDDHGSIDNPQALINYFESITGLGGVRNLGIPRVWPHGGDDFNNEFRLRFECEHFPGGYSKQRTMFREAIERFLALSAEFRGSQLRFSDYEAEHFHERTGDLWVVSIAFSLVLQ